MNQHCRSLNGIIWFMIIKKQIRFAVSDYSACSHVHAYLCGRTFTLRLNMQQRVRWLISVRQAIIKLILQMQWLLYIRRQRGWQTETGDMDRVPQPWERTDKGSKWPNSGSFGKERESELAGHSLGKKWESPGGRQHWPSRERLMKPEQESSECCWELSP